MENKKTVSKEHSKMRLDKVSTIIFEDFSRTQIKKWILEGRVFLNDDIASPRDLVHEGDSIQIDPITEEKISWVPEEIDIDVIYENDDYLIINKQPNLIMHPGAGCSSGTLANALLHHYPELKNIARAGIVHRLDKDTSGVILVARNDKFRNYFVDLLQKREVTKLYSAIVVGTIIGSFKVTDPIGRDKKNRVKMSIRSDGKESETFVKLKESLGNYSLLDISIMTGRTHQIRVHLSSKKLPIIGDNTYNPAKNIAKGTSSKLIDIIKQFPRQALHAYQLSFKDMHTDEFKTFNSDIPDDMKYLIDILKKDI